MRLPGKESLLMGSPVTINEILDVSISFLNDHLEETPGSTKKIEENHSKCINLAQVSVSS